MANWITHVLLAERLLNRGLPLDERGFCIGSIAPDCNVENADWTAFTPPRAVTHWMTGNSKLTADYEGFYRDHVAGRSFQSAEEHAFLLGYCAHLFTDALYQSFVRDPARTAACFSRIKGVKGLSFRTAGLPETFDTLKSVFGKKRLFQDIAVLENNAVAAAPHCAYNRILRNTTAFPDYLDILPTGAVARKIPLMTYAVQQTFPETDLVFFTKDEYYGFLEEAEAVIFRFLKEKLS